MNHSWETFSTAFGSFCGAVAAFAIYLLTSRLDRVHTAQTRHFRAMVGLERLLNKTLNCLSETESAIAQVRHAIDVDELVYALPQPLPLDEAAITEVVSWEIVNEMTIINTDIRRANNDIVGLNDTYARVRDNTIDAPDHIRSVNLNRVSQQLQGFADQLPKLVSEVRWTLSRVRLGLAKDTPTFRHGRLRWTVSIRRPRSEEINAELRALETEIAKMGAKPLGSHRAEDLST